MATGDKRREQQARRALAARRRALRSWIEPVKHPPSMRMTAEEFGDPAKRRAREIESARYREQVTAYEVARDALAAKASTTVVYPEVREAVASATGTGRLGETLSAQPVDDEPPWVALTTWIGRHLPCAAIPETSSLTLNAPPLAHAPTSPGAVL